jgi:hypothetical protein
MPSVVWHLLILTLVSLEYVNNSYILCRDLELWPQTDDYNEDYWI